MAMANRNSDPLDRNISPPFADWRQILSHFAAYPNFTAGRSRSARHCVLKGERSPAARTDVLFRHLAGYLHFNDTRRERRKGCRSSWTQATNVRNCGMVEIRPRRHD